MSEANGYVTRDELFGKPTQRRFKDVVVQGKKFRLRSLTAGELNPWAAKSQDVDGAATAGPRLIVLMVVNGDGQRICPVCQVAVLVKKNPHGPGRYPSACEACR